MLQLAFVSTWTAALAVLGFWVGSTIHGTTLAAFVPTVAGAAGGFGMGCALLEVARRARSSRTEHGPGPHATTA